MLMENIETSRDSVSNILMGNMPRNETEEKIYGLKRGYEYIGDSENRINEESIHELYQLSINKYLDDDSKLPKGSFYRNGPVYISGNDVVHSGLKDTMLPEYMGNIIEFINRDDGMNELVKAAVIHFYIAYIHPYFDGNGRMARLMHQWFLLQKGYPSVLLYSFSRHINKSRNSYYKAFMVVEENAKLLKLMDITSFIIYTTEYIYNKLSDDKNINGVMEKFKEELEKGSITEKERDLFRFVMSAYGDMEFSTKQLEKDFREAGLLSGQKLGTKVKYRINM